jgi:putative transposase
VIRRAIKYRLRPTTNQVAVMEQWLYSNSRLYNACIQERRDHWEQKGVSVTASNQSAALPSIRQGIQEYNEVHAQVLQDVVKRVDLAYQAFFRRVKQGETPGYPRFKSHRRYDSFTYKQPKRDGSDFEDSRVNLSKIGSVRYVPHRTLPDEIRTLMVTRRAGKWYLIVSGVVNDRVIERKNNGEIGIDWGISTTLNLSNGEKINRGAPVTRTMQRILHWQRILARRRKRSGRWLKAKQHLNNVWLDYSNARRDWEWKTARKLVQEYDHIVIEDLNLKELAQKEGPRSLRRGLHESGVGSFVQALECKAEEADTVITKVNPAFTSQTCSVCGNIKRKSLQERMHRCECGHSRDRDHEAAVVILERARTEPPWREPVTVLVETGSPFL